MSFFKNPKKVLQREYTRIEQQAKQLIAHQVNATSKYDEQPDQPVQPQPQIIIEHVYHDSPTSSASSSIYKRFETEFEELSVFGSGGFGTVFKVKHKIDQQMYAIKKIILRGEEREKCLDEIKTLAKIKSEYVVNYSTSWSEEDSIYIQMELCPENLDSIIQEKSKYFNNNGRMDQAEYYICCEMFKEILECVRYLHDELKPPVIHLDIKPPNILVTKQNKNGKFIKLCDFGLSKMGNVSTVTLSTAKGTSRYMAPEVSPPNGKPQISTKADIYSLGMTAMDLVEFDDIHDTDHSLCQKWEALTKTIIGMTAAIYKLRPSSAQLLSDANEWAIERKDFTYDLFNNLTMTNQTSIFYDYIVNKLA